MNNDDKKNNIYIDIEDDFLNIDGTIFRHFKGGFYVKLLEAEDSETGEIMIVYKNIQGGKPYSGKIYIRSKKEFEEIIEKPNYKGPRFTKIE